MADRVDLGPVEDLPTDACVAVADGRAVAVRLEDGEVVAFHPNCLHRASPLAGGLVVEGGRLQCPLHFWRYELPSGVHTGGRGVLRRYPVTLEDGHAFVDLPDPPPTTSLREQLLAHAREWDRDAPRQPPTSRRELGTGQRSRGGLGGGGTARPGGGCLEERHRS